MKQDAKQKASEEKRKPLVEQMEEKKKDIEKKKEGDKEPVVVGGKILIQRIRRSSFSSDSRSMFIVKCCFSCGAVGSTKKPINGQEEVISIFFELIIKTIAI